MNIKKEKPLNVLFLYSGVSRKSLLSKFQAGAAPDSSFFGMQNLSRIPGVHVDFYEGGMAREGKLVRWIRKYTKLDLSPIAALLKVWNYNIVVSPVGLALLFLISFWPFKKPAWFVFNINLTTLLVRSRNNILRYRLLLRALSRATHIISLSSAQKNYLVAAGIGAGKISVVCFGVDKDFYAPTLAGRRPGYILSVGRDSGRDYETLFASVKDFDAKFVVVCSHQNLENIKEIPSNVEIVFDADYTTLRELYRNALFVVVSSQPDSYPEGSDCSGQTVILDAMASGRAVIATYRTWMDDYFSGDEECLIIPPKSPSELREKISLLINSSETADAVGRKARKRIEKDLNSEYMAKQMYAIFEQYKK